MTNIKLEAKLLALNSLLGDVTINKEDLMKEMLEAIIDGNTDKAGELLHQYIIEGSKEVCFTSAKKELTKEEYSNA